MATSSATSMACRPPGPSSSATARRPRCRPSSRSSARPIPTRRSSTATSIFADPNIDVICIAAIPRDRADLAVRAMRAGKDAMVDKPGVTTCDQLDEVRHRPSRDRPHLLDLLLRAPLRAGRGQGRPSDRGGGDRPGVPDDRHRTAQEGDVRPDWFWDAENLAASSSTSHRTRSTSSSTSPARRPAEVVAAQTGNFGTPEHPGSRTSATWSCGPTRARAMSGSTG